MCFAAEVAKTAEQSSDPVAQIPAAGTYPNALLSLAADTTSFSRYALLVDKAARTLTIWENDGNKIKFVEAFPADIGAQSGDKVSEGDFKTPEGIYFFQTTMDGHKVDFSLYGARIFTMDYPNYFDRLEHKTGRGIWLHAIPDTKTLRRGSRGCVVLRNAVIDKVGHYIELKRTPIVVVNQVEYLNEADWLAKQAEVKQWLESWRQAWGGKDLDKYMELYSERFRGNHMNKAQWREYKKKLASRYEFINIDLKDVQIFSQGNKIVWRFVQDYKSNQKSDLGTKILYALKENGKFEIVGENWEPLKAVPSNLRATAGTADEASATAPAPEQK